MYTKIKTKGGVILEFVSQQYEVGTYFIINNNSKLQGTSSLKEEDFHKKVRKSFLKTGGILLDGTYIEVKRKSKYDINDFKEK